MATYSLSHKQLEELWIRGGGSPDTADVAAAIAQAESGGCQYALAGPRDIRPVKVCTWKRTSRENSCGFWQINLRAHPQYSAPSIFQQDVNASAAVAISGDGTNFNPWTTYRTGAYKQYLSGSGPPTVYTPPPETTNPNAIAAHAHKGWADLRNSLNHHLPNQLETSRRLGVVALRSLGHRHKVGH